MASLAYRGVAVVRRPMGRGNLTTVSEVAYVGSGISPNGSIFPFTYWAGLKWSTGNVLDKLVRRGDIVLDIGANIGAHARSPSAWEPREASSLLSQAASLSTD